MAVALIWMGLVGLLAMGINSEELSTFTTLHNETGPLANISTNATTKRQRDVVPRVSFNVKRATDKLTAVAHVHFQEVVTNTGGGWDNTTSEFVVPVAGRYLFIFGAISDRTNDFALSLTHNGVNRATAYATTTTLEYASTSVTLDLYTLDRISLQLQQGTIHEKPGEETFTTFVGYLLFAW
ncbi:cerebellin-3-like [Procambarus clarkii]|uniref:cerebellin-3-like n=1 Tax=Procambarus clarkii TaxID=6728 RepID=UPI001E67042C|nr:cerebellin-3-like [Procambarus clarkii]